MGGGDEENSVYVVREKCVCVRAVFRQCRARAQCAGPLHKGPLQTPYLYYVAGGALSNATSQSNHASAYMLEAVLCVSLKLRMS